MKLSPYEDEKLLQMDYNFVLKKLGIDPDWFEKYLSSPPVSHSLYRTDEKICKTLKEYKISLLGNYGRTT